MSPTGAASRTSSAGLGDAVGGECRVDLAERAGGELGVDAVDERLVGLLPADEPDALVAREPRPHRSGVGAPSSASTSCSAVGAEHGEQRGMADGALGRGIRGTGSLRRSRTIVAQKNCTSVRCQSRSAAVQSGHDGTRASRVGVAQQRGEAGRFAADGAEVVERHAADPRPGSTSALPPWPRDGPVHLLRHGEVHNPDGVLYGAVARLRAQRPRRAPGPGRRGLARGPTTSATWPPSPLQRAQQTAAPLAAATGLAIAPDERLIEAANHLQGRPVAGGKGC